jgi:uncharacterized protein (TIGR02246 family)
MLESPRLESTLAIDSEVDMTVRELQAWLERYGDAWQARDADRAAALFTDDVAYYETPFGEPARGKDGVRAYWRAATQHQRDVRFSCEILSVAGDVGIARWWAEYARASSGARARLDGIFLLEFDADGRCRTLREWWHRTDAGAQGADGYSSSHR